MSERIVILVPTAAEATPLLASDLRNRGYGIVAIEICGAGMAETSAATHSAINRHNPTLLILAGVAGHYEGSQLRVGDIALVEKECIADLGAIHPDGFKPMFAKEYNCEYATEFNTFIKASGNTVNTGATQFADIKGRDLENMEGAAFFAVCIAAGVRFLELRSISNPVSALRQGWNLPLAVERLAKGLDRLLGEISKSKR